MDLKKGNLLTVIAHLLIPGRRTWALDWLSRAGLIDNSSKDCLGEELSRSLYNYRNTGVRLSEAKMFIDQMVERHEYCFLNPDRTMNHIMRRHEAAPGCFSSLHGKSIIDYGCGTLSTLNQAIILCANGAKIVYAVEPGRIRWEMAKRAAMETVKAIFARPQAFRIGNASDAEMRANLAAIDFSALEKAAGNCVDLGSIKVQMWLADLGEVQADLIVSTSVLEHVSDIPGEISRQKSMMKKGASAVHSVDFTDHRHAHPQYEPFKFYYDGVTLDCNGLRFSEMVSAIEDAGLQCRIANKQNIEISQIRRPDLIDRFRGKSDDDLTTRSATLVLQA